MDCLKTGSCSYLVRRVEELEEKVNNLRVSRRILLSLIEKIQKENLVSLEKLTDENRKLKLENLQFAKKLFAKNNEIYNLQHGLSLGRDLK